MWSRAPPARVFLFEAPLRFRSFSPPVDRGKSLTALLRMPVYSCSRPPSSDHPRKTRKKEYWHPTASAWAVEYALPKFLLLRPPGDREAPPRLHPLPQSRTTWHSWNSRYSLQCLDLDQAHIEYASITSHPRSVGCSAQGRSAEFSNREIARIPPAARPGQCGKHSILAADARRTPAPER